jgi:hypothetical protein
MENSEQRQVYQITDVQLILKIQKSAAYSFIKQVYKTGNPFHVVKIGASYRIPRTGFDRWVNGENTRGEPAVYDIRQLQNILGIKRTAAYNLVSKVYLAQAPFRILKIGSLYRIPQYSLDNWLNGKTECEK